MTQFPAPRPMGGTQRRTVWREEKRQRTLSLSDTCWAIASSFEGLNRSEVFEILTRYCYKYQLDLVQLREVLAKEIPEPKQAK
jgi:hypothetical protein